MMKTVLVSATASVCFVLGCFTTIIVTGHDPTSFSQFILILVPIVATQLVNLSKTSEISTVVTRVDKNVNGHMTTLISRAFPTPPDDKGNSNGQP